MRSKPGAKPNSGYETVQLDLETLGAGEGAAETETDSLYTADRPSSAAARPKLSLRERCGATRGEVRVAVGFVMVLLAIVLLALPSPLGRANPPPAAAATLTGRGGSCPAASQAAATPGTQIATIFDSDFGSFMDDSFALAYALGSPELRIELAIAVGGLGQNPKKRARCLGRHLREAGRGHVLLAAGPPAPGPDIYSLENWGADYVLEDHPGGFVEDAAAAAAQLVRRQAAVGQQVVWVVLGPSTAVANFSDRFPELRQFVKVVAMGVSVCSGVTLPWGPNSPWPVTNELQNVGAANEVIRAHWGGGPVLFAPLQTSSQVVVDDADYVQIVDASKQRATSPGLATLLDSYRSWWTESMSAPDNGAEAATVNPETVSVEIFDGLAVYLAFSTRGLTVHTVDLLFRNDGLAAVQAHDLEELPCDTSQAPTLSDEATREAGIVGIAAAWQPGQLEVFIREMVARIIAGGRPCID
eukprot:SAG31_NODE_6193_length_2128_cov_5.134056_1_plen_472_part_00